MQTIKIHFSHVFSFFGEVDLEKDKLLRVFLSACDILKNAYSKNQKEESQIKKYIFKNPTKIGANSLNFIKISKPISEFFLLWKLKSWHQSSKNSKNIL